MSGEKMTEDSGNQGRIKSGGGGEGDDGELGRTDMPHPSQRATSNRFSVEAIG